MSTAPAFSPGPAAPAAPRSAASSDARASSCSCSAPTTSPRRCRARSGSARGRGTVTMRSYSSRLEAVAFENLWIDHDSSGGLNGRPAATLSRSADFQQRERSGPRASARSPIRRSRGRRRRRAATSHARSGCGIMPTTLRRSLQRPAIAFTDPFGFDASSDAALRIGVAEARPGDSPRACCEHLRRREVVAFAVADRNPQHLAGGARRS